MFHLPPLGGFGSADLTVFDEFVMNQTAVYTGAEHDANLGQYDQFGFSLVVDNVNVTGGTANVGIEHSADGIHWISKNGTTPDLTATLSGMKTTAAGQDQSGKSSLAFVRLRVYLTGATTSARVRVQVTPRDNS